MDEKEIGFTFEGREQPTPILYEEGWKDILESEDAAGYQKHFAELVSSTQIHLKEEWASDREEVIRRWKVIVECIVNMSISQEDRDEMTDPEKIETGLVTLVTNLESLGWLEEGGSFEVPYLTEVTDEQEAIPEELDIRKVY